MLLDSALTELLLAKDYTPITARRRVEALRGFFTWAAAHDVTQVEELTRPLLRRYVAHLREVPNRRYGGCLASETQHSCASIVRMYVRFCAREGWLDERVAAHFDMPRIVTKVIEVLSYQQYLRLLHATDDCPLPALQWRDKAMLSLLFDSGVRAMEVCLLTRDAVFLDMHEAYIRVEGKGRKQREVGIGKQASLAIHRYLTRGRPASDRPQVFLSRDGRAMTPNAIDRALYRLRDVAGCEHFQGVRVSAHTLRHSFAVHFMEQGGDIYRLSRLLGHEHVTTTERYLRAYQARDARKGVSVLDSLATQHPERGTRQSTRKRPTH